MRCWCRDHSFDTLRENELIPGPKASAEQIRELARLASASFGHAVGTCKMGADKLAAVDPELGVNGILGVRVADASVMPQIIKGAGDKRVGPHDCGPRHPADSRLTTGDRMIGNRDTSLRQESFIRQKRNAGKDTAESTSVETLVSRQRSASESRVSWACAEY